MNKNKGVFNLDYENTVVMLNRMQRLKARLKAIAAKLKLVIDREYLPKTTREKLEDIKDIAERDDE